MEIFKFAEHRPSMDVPVWVWDNGKWRIALLETSMYPLHLSEHDRASWSFIGSEMRRALPQDIWVPAMEPVDKPEKG